MNFFCNIIVNLANDREVLSTSCCAIEVSHECTDLITLLYRLIYDCSLVIEKKREANALRIKLARLDKKVSRLGIEINTSFSLDLS